MSDIKSNMTITSPASMSGQTDIESKLRPKKLNKDERQEKFIREEMQRI